MCGAAPLCGCFAMKVKAEADPADPVKHQVDAEQQPEQVKAVAGPARENQHAENGCHERGEHRPAPGAGRHFKAEPEAHEPGGQETRP
eukprot:gene35480-41886_t